MGDTRPHRAITFAIRLLIVLLALPVLTLDSLARLYYMGLGSTLYRAYRLVRWVFEPIVAP